MRHIHKSDVANNFESFGKRNNGRDFLVLNKHFVSDDSRYQEIAALFRSMQEVEVTDVEQVIGAGCIADTNHCSDLQCISLALTYREDAVRCDPVFAFQFDIVELA